MVMADGAKVSRATMAEVRARVLRRARKLKEHEDAETAVREAKRQARIEFQELAAKTSEADAADILAEEGRIEREALETGAMFGGVDTQATTESKSNECDASCSICTPPEFFRTQWARDDHIIRTHRHAAKDVLRARACASITARRAQLSSGGLAQKQGTTDSEGQTRKVAATTGIKIADANVKMCQSAEKKTVSRKKRKRDEKIVSRQKRQGEKKTGPTKKRKTEKKTNLKERVDTKVGHNPDEIPADTQEEEMEKDTSDLTPKKPATRKATEGERARRIREQSRANARNRHRMQSCILKLYFSRHQCMDCGTSDADVLENDHPNNDKMRTKDFSHTINMMGIAPNKLKQELNKTEPVCAIDHRIRTHERSKSNPLRQKVWRAVLVMRTKVNLEKAKIGMCDCCHRPWDPNLYYLFDFDHRDPKTKKHDVSDMVLAGNKYSWKDVLKEIEKCRLLCANCHRKHTKEMAIISGETRLTLRDFSDEEKAKAKIFLDGTDEEIAAISMKRRPSKPVAQINKSTHEVMKVFRSCREAGRAINPTNPVPAAGAIYRCLIGKLQEYENCLWKSPSTEHLKRLSEEDKARTSIATEALSRPAFLRAIRKVKGRKPVVKVDPNTNEIINIFPSIAEAAKSVYRGPRTYPETEETQRAAAAAENSVAMKIGCCMSGQQRTAYGFIWEHAHPDHFFLLDGFIAGVTIQS
jgi:hypothetical protein